MWSRRLRAQAAAGSVVESWPQVNTILAATGVQAGDMVIAEPKRPSDFYWNARTQVATAPNITAVRHNHVRVARHNMCTSRATSVFRPPAPLSARCPARRR